MAIWVLIALCLAQFTAVTYCCNLPWFWFLVTSYIFAATISHSCNLLIHELTHFTCFETIFYNKLLGIIANLPTGVPSAITFGRYHTYSYKDITLIITHIWTLKKWIQICLHNGRLTSLARLSESSALYCFRPSFMLLDL